MTTTDTFRLEIYEEYVDSLPNQLELSHGDFVMPLFAQTVAVDDGYREADITVEITIGDDIDRTLVLMTSTLHDGSRTNIDSIQDESALERARKYAAATENGEYYAITDGSRVQIKCLSADLDFETEVALSKFGDAILSIVEEERRIRDSRAFVAEIQEFHSKIEPYVRKAISSKIESDPDFEERIQKFLTPIGMSYQEDEEIPTETLGMLSMQAGYLLIDKLLFSIVIRENEQSLRDGSIQDADEIFTKLDQEPPIPSSVDESWAADFWGYLQDQFSTIRRIDYEPIFDPKTSPLNEVDLSEHPAACFHLKELIDLLYGKDKLSELFDGPLLAKLYEGLIPADLRWKWGQTYTPPTVTRLISDWAIDDADDQVLDPACGTGRFLISSYARLADLKGIEIGECHQEVIDQIQGVDINQFPAHLATMSLAAMSLTSITREVNISVRDFFSQRGKGQASLLEDTSSVEMTGREVEDEESSSTTGYQGASLPQMDAIVMNPPYTQAEALGDKYKSEVREMALSNIYNENDDSIEMDGKASFYSYFITHGTKFLRDQGRFGMLIQNSWLDTDYGADIQEFLLENYKIKAIIGTENERIIKTADINTVVVLLEKEPKEKKRAANDVHFVQLKHGVEWFEKNYGYEKLLEFIETGESPNKDDMRIIVKNQNELRQEGMGTTVYTGTTWGEYIKAPDIYFELLEEFGQEFTEVKDLGKLRRGMRTGANRFFYLPNPHFELEENGTTLELTPVVDDTEYEDVYKIEPDFWMHKADDGSWEPNYLLKNTKEFDQIIFDIEDLDFGNSLKYVLIIDQPKSELPEGITGYIEWGEEHDPDNCDLCGRKSKPFPDSCNQSGAGWYDLSNGIQRGDLLPMQNIYERPNYWTPNSRPYVDQRMHGIAVDGKDKDRLCLAALLNSTLGTLMVETGGRDTLGQGALDVTSDDHRELKVPDPAKIDPDTKANIIDHFEEVGNRQTGTIFDELGADTGSEFSIDGIKDDRRKLDRAIFEEILELSKTRQLQIYRSVLNMIRSRVEKGESGE